MNAPIIEKGSPQSSQDPTGTSAPSHAHRTPSLKGQAEQRPPSGSMMKRMLIMLAIVVLFIAGIGAWKIMQIRAGMAQFAKFAPPPTAVTTTVAARERWQPALSAVGSLRAVNGVTVSTDLAGIISQISFQSRHDSQEGGPSGEAGQPAGRGATAFGGSPP